MKPKKNEPQDDAKSRFERVQAEHEMFLQAFEKPTQIYRYLRSRTAISPIFLQRCVRYMPGQSTRKANTRKTFKIDSILSRVEERHRKENPQYSYKSEFMNIVFAGFLDQSESRGVKYEAEVEVSLLKICHKKRKDVSSPVLKVNLGKVKITVNPEESISPSNQETVSIGSDRFSHNNGHSVKSYALLFKVTCPQDKSMLAPLVNGMCNGTASDSHRSDDEPSPKRRRSLHNQHSTHQNTSPGKSNSAQDCTLDVTYGAELVVYDKYQRCLLTDGDYELVLQDLRNKAPAKKQATWETVMDGRAVGPFEVFNKCPTLKFKLSWSQTELASSSGNFISTDPSDNTPAEQRSIIPKHLMPRLEMMERRCREAVSPSKRKRIFYQFLYNNNAGQQTEARDDLHCPWCSVHCLQLYSLLKHLRCCHARFNFAYMISVKQEHPKGARIDVSINQCYDGAYVGNPQDLHSHLGYAFSRNGPVRRTPVTHVLVYRPTKHLLYDMAEFMEPETDTHSTRPIVQGHNRLYYHTITCQPIRACELDEDSEEENDPLWLRQKTMQMIDDFTDVNEGEKEVMKLWNLHIMRHNFIGDFQMPRACTSFVEEHGVRILSGNLVRNFVLHLVNLYDFGLVRPEAIYRTVIMLLQLRNKLEASGQITYSAHTGFLDSDMCNKLYEELAKCVPSYPYSKVLPTSVPPSPSLSVSAELPS